MVKTKVGGKLYWAGEYAVVESGHTAIIKEVNCFLTAELSFTQVHGNIHSSLFSHQIVWTYKNGELQIERHNDYTIIIHTIELMSEYLSQKGIEQKVFDLKINSDLHDSDFQKYGFGSSGAVVVAVVRGMLRLYGLQEEDMLIFKLACLVLLKMGNNGSMGDVACCTYGGLIAYTSFNRSKILQDLTKKTMVEIVEMEWENLRIRRIENRLPMKVYVGWTGEEAISSKMVYKIGQIKGDAFYPVFLKQSEELVNKLIVALENADKEVFIDCMNRLRLGLVRLSEVAQTEIETPKLKKIAEIASDLKGVGKLSGAGGGDCGLVFLFEETDYRTVIQKFDESHIQYLPFV